MMSSLTQMLLAASASPAALILVKATTVTLLGLAGGVLAHRGRASVRYALLAAVFAVLLLLPAATLFAPPLRVQIVTPTVQAPSTILEALPGPLTNPVMRVSDSAVHPAEVNWPLAIWLAGMALFLVPVGLGLWQVGSLRRSALPWPEGRALIADSPVRRRVEVLLHEDLAGPMTCGIIHPAIVLPAEATAWDAADLRRALIHELEHVRRLDWATQCLARVVCAAYWFHPLVWMAWRKLTLEAERSCDDAVLQSSEATAYADQLVGLARKLSAARRSPLLAMVNRSDLSVRVGSVLDSRRQRGRMGARSVAFACVAAAVVLVTVSPLRMVAAPAPMPVPAPVPVPAAAAPAPATPAAAPAPHPAPQSTSQLAQPAIQFQSRTNLVTVSVTVTDLNGKSIEGLGARDFVVTEDGVTQTISRFEYQTVAAPTPNGPTSYYLIGYYTKNQKADGQFRKIQVTDVNDSTAKVEARSGYYANAPVPPGGGRGPDVAALVPPLPPGSTAPVLIFKKEAEYSEEARKAKYQGTVVLNVTVNEDGTVGNVKVLRSLGLGLDEKAIEAVQHWKFKPGTTNGVPAAMQTAVTVNFQLL